MAGCEFAVLVAEKGCFGGQYGRAGVKRKLRKRFCFAKKAAFSVHAKPSIKKSFF